MEVKYSMLSDKAAMRIVDIAQECKMSPILVVSKYINSEKRGYLQEKYSNLILIDISNLLFAVSCFQQVPARVDLLIET